LHIDNVVKGEEDKPLGQRRDGTTFPAVVERNESSLDGRSLCVVTVHNISEQRQTEERLASLAYYDWLTGLPNRLLFDDRLQLEIAHAQRGRTALAVLFIDLDNFKPVNDIYGHAIGDSLLRNVAIRLRRCLRESDTLSRRSGDEFTAIATKVGNRQSCERIARLVLSQLALPFRIESHDIKIGASIGISLFPSDGNDADVLVSHADEAMYRAKQAGRNSFRFYSDAAMQQAAA
jgi:diguanylate cyclase (GGDEF)-like protein